MQAGAKHVYGIERSAIAEQAKQIVQDNGYQDTVTIIQGKVEEVDLPVQQVQTAPSRSTPRSPPEAHTTTAAFQCLLPRDGPFLLSHLSLEGCDTRYGASTPVASHT